tara:strand:- start:822 stop:1007 length:186 start_codon:yes stop_codon:yes gene_type:complete
MTADKVLTHKDLVKMYRKKFGKDPEYSGADWARVGATRLIVEALDTGIPIQDDPVPKGVDT